MTEQYLFDKYERLSRSAELSEDGRYRWWLCRSWQYGGDGKVVCFVMLNPSTADAMIDDPTIRRCMGFVRDWGHSVLSVRNLFALRATDPKEIRRFGIDATGGKRGDLELRVAGSADILIAAWGGSVPWNRDLMALELFGTKIVYCLGTTKAGAPRHPLYVRKDQPLVRFR